MTRRLLLVDDEADILHTLKEVLELQLGLPLEMDTASDGEAGLRALETRPYDMVIADERMPGLRGSALLRWAREHRPATVRVLITAFAESALAEPVLRDVEVLAFKPFDLGQLIPGLRSALEQRPPATVTLGGRPKVIASGP